MKDCNIVRDLLPLYADNSCSEDGREFVEKHLSECEACRMLHESTQKTVQTILSHRNAKKSFGAFRRRILTKRVLLIALCVLLALIPLGIWAYDAYSSYQFSQYWPRPARVEPIAVILGELSDGSIYLHLQYTDSDVYVNSFSTSRSHLNNPFTEDEIWFEDDGTFYIQPGYSPIEQKDPRDLSNNSLGKDYILATEESYGKYEQPRGEHEGFNRAYTRIVLIGSDGERVIWQAGDELPPAPIKGEAMLEDMIDGVWFVPVNEN